MNLQIDDKMYRDLLALAKEYKSQNIQHQAYPCMFTIRHTDDIECHESQAEKYYWLDTYSGDFCQLDDEEAKEWCKDNNFYFDEDEDELGDDEKHLIKHWFKSVKNFENRGAVNCFFTRNAAQQYIENDRHNLSGDPHTFAFTPKKNREMKLIADFLMTLADLKEEVSLHGKNIGDKCNRDGCNGVMGVPLEIQEAQCSCHINPPCSKCSNEVFECDECGSLSND